MISINVSNLFPVSPSSSQLAIEDVDFSAIPFDAFSFSEIANEAQQVIASLRNSDNLKTISNISGVIDTLNLTLSRPNHLSNPTIFIGSAILSVDGAISNTTVRYLDFSNLTAGTLTANSKPYSHTLDALVTPGKCIINSQAIESLIAVLSSPEPAATASFTIWGILIQLKRPITVTSSSIEGVLPYFLDPVGTRDLTWSKGIATYSQRNLLNSKVVSLNGEVLASQTLRSFPRTVGVLPGASESGGRTTTLSCSYSIVTSDIVDAGNPQGFRPVVVIPANFYNYLQFVYNKRFGTNYVGKVHSAHSDSELLSPMVNTLMLIHDAYVKRGIEFGTRNSEFNLLCSNSIDKSSFTGGSLVLSGCVALSATKDVNKGAVTFLPVILPGNYASDGTTKLFIVPPRTGSSENFWTLAKFMIPDLVMDTPINVSSGVISTSIDINSEYDRYSPSFSYPDVASTITQL